MNRTVPLAALLLLAAAGAAQGPVLRTPAASSAGNAAVTQWIGIPTVVRDKHEDLVPSLTKDSFVLQVDGHPQPIASFSSAKDAPLAVGLLFDTAMSYRDVLDEERAASSEFVNNALSVAPPGSKAFIVQFARQIDLLQDATASKPMLQDALKQLTSSGNRNVASVTDASDTRSSEGSKVTAALYDSLFLSADEIMSNQKGRKVLIVLSDGVDNGSKESLETVADAAKRADTVIYAIYFKGKEPNTDHGFHIGQADPDCSGGYPGGYPPGYPGGYPGSYPGDCPSSVPVPQGIPLPQAKKTMQHLVAETGGRLFEVGGKDTIAEIYRQIGEELQSQYLLGYGPAKDTASGGFHRIALSLANSNPKDFSVRTRDGYDVGD